MLTSKIKSRSFHQFTEEHRDGKRKKREKALPLPQAQRRIKEGTRENKPASSLTSKEDNRLIIA